MMYKLKCKWGRTTLRNRVLRIPASVGLTKDLKDDVPPDAPTELNEEEQNWVNSKMPNVQVESNNNKKKKEKKRDDDEELDTRPKFTTYKYSDNGKGDLYEAVLVGGIPYFLHHREDIKNIEGVGEISEQFRILVPPQPSEYSYPPYEFANTRGISKHMHRGQTTQLGFSSYQSPIDSFKV